MRALNLLSDVGATGQGTPVDCAVTPLIPRKKALLQYRFGANFVGTVQAESHATNLSATMALITGSNFTVGANTTSPIVVELDVPEGYIAGNVTAYTSGNVTAELLIDD
jgi:hypothetical protein